MNGNGQKPDATRKGRRYKGRLQKSLTEGNKIPRLTYMVTAPLGCDVFKSPHGCSGTHPVGNDEIALVPQSRNETRSVGNDETVLVPQGCSRTHPVGNDETTLSAKTRPVTSCPIERHGRVRRRESNET